MVLHPSVMSYFVKLSFFFLTIILIKSKKYVIINVE